MDYKERSIFFVGDVRPTEFDKAPVDGEYSDLIDQGEALIRNRTAEIRAKISEEFGIPKRYVMEFWERVSECANSFEHELMVREIPKHPVRDIAPRENVIEYLRSAEGLGPWLRAGILDRPSLRKLSPKAYMALSNWLRNPAHSLEKEGIDIPTKWDVVAVRQSDPEVVREASRISSAAYRRRAQARPQP